jgi:L-amino acid N-acyltransferase YncA
MKWNMNIIIEAMQPGDWDQVRAIYLEGLATGNSSFETVAPTWEHWNEAHHQHSRLVARNEGRVIAWAALSPSLYVAAAARGQGVGKRLMQELIESSERHGIWTLVGGTFPENTASIQLQLSCGFRIVGRRERIAQHYGVWRDTIITERRSQAAGVAEPPTAR